MNINYKHLKKMRELSGLTQVQLGERLGLKLTTSTKNPNRLECSLISQYENGTIKKIPFDFAQRWATFCGFELFSETEILITQSKFLDLRKIKVRYSNIVKSTGTKSFAFAELKNLLLYEYFQLSCKYIVPIDDYFELIEISRKYHKILKTINE